MGGLIMGMDTTMEGTPSQATHIATATPIIMDATIALIIETAQATITRATTTAMGLTVMATPADPVVVILGIKL